MSALNLRHPAVLVLSAVALGCASTRVQERPPPPVEQPACPAIRLPVGDSITVAMTTELDATRLVLAPNAAQRFVLERTYETLVRVDCNGNVLPALAGTWLRESDGRWTFTLRDSARYWNGANVLPSDIIETWMLNARALSDSVLARVARGAVARDARRITVMLPDSTPLLLAEPRFALLRIGAGSSWTDGTGPYRIVQRGNTELHSVGGGDAVIRLLTTSPQGARDVLDQNLDLLFTDDPGVLRYAASRRDLRVEPLEWDYTWVLFIPDRLTAASAQVSPAFDRAAQLQIALASNLSTLGARQPQTPVSGALNCSWPQLTEARGSRAAPLQRIAYRGDQPVAKELAERIVALAGIAVGNDSALIRAVAPEIVAIGSRITAQAYGASTFTDLVGAHAAFGFVLPLAPSAAGACSNAALIPLVDTRWHVITPTQRGY